MQERQRQGIVGIHMESLHEHMDRPDLQRLLGQVLHRTRPFLDGPPPALPNLTEVVMSRYNPKRNRLLVCLAAQITAGYRDPSNSFCISVLDLF